MTPAVRVEGLRHVYPDGHLALDGVNLTVEAGERVAVLGPNGAGKTSLMLHLNGVLTATSGTVEISGIPIARNSLRQIRQRVGVVFQDPDDQLFMPTVAQDVAFGPANFGVRGAELADRYSFAELRVTHEQNLVLTDVRLQDLPALHAALLREQLATPYTGLLNDMIACPGGDFCSLANAKSIPIAEAIQ